MADGEDERLLPGTPTAELPRPGKEADRCWLAGSAGSTPHQELVRAVAAREPFLRLPAFSIVSLAIRRCKDQPGCICPSPFMPMPVPVPIHSRTVLYKYSTSTVWIVTGSGIPDFYSADERHRPFSSAPMLRTSGFSTSGIFNVASDVRCRCRIITSSGQGRGMGYEK